MSRLEKGNIFVNRFSRVALALSAVTSSFVFADVNVTEVTTPNLDEALVSTGSISADGDSLNNTTDVSGALVVGDYTETTNTTTTTRSFISGDNTVGSIVGVDINNTLANVSNDANVTVSAATMSSLVTDTANGTTSYPDVNNTKITAVGVNVSEAVTGSIVTSGTITAMATLNNDTNNSTATAVGINIESDVGSGIVNTGSISATAIKNDIRDTNGDAEGGIESYTQAINGGHTGIQEERVVDSVTGASNSSITQVTAQTGIYAKDEAEDRTASEAGRTLYENDFKSTGEVVTEYETSNVVTNTLRSAGVRIADTATVTGGLTDHGYISSVLNEGTLAGDTTNGSKNGLTVTPGELSISSGGTAPTDPTLSEADLNQSIADAQAAEDAKTAELAQYESDLAAYNQGLEDWQTANPDGIKDLLRNDDENSTQDRSSDKAKYYIDGNFDGDLNSSAIEEYIATQANLTKPTPPVDDVDRTVPDAGGSAGTPPTVAANPIVDGVKVARIGTLVNDGDIIGADGGYGIEVRATSGSNVDSLLSDQNANLDANSTNNAFVTSGSASAYIGEGSEGRVVTQNGAGEVSNTLVGGILNNGNITGGAGNSAIFLNADSSVGVNKDDNSSDNLAISTVTDENGDKIAVQVDPSSTVAVGSIVNNSTITGGDGKHGIELLSVGNVDVLANNDTNITGGKLNIAPESLVSVGTLLNNDTIKGGTGGAAIALNASSEAGIKTEDGLIEGADISISPLVTSRVDLLINSKDIKGGSGGSGIEGEAKSVTNISSKDINNSTLRVTPVVNSTIGDLYNTGDIKVSLGKDAISLTASGEAGLITDKVKDSTVIIDSQTTAGVRIKGNDASTGNVVNGGEISVALSTNALNLSAEGKAETQTSSSGPNIIEMLNSNITVKDTTTAGIEGSFVNIATTIDENRTKTVSRGTIKASLSKDGLVAEAKGATTLKVKDISDSTVTYAQSTTAGIGGDFINGGGVTGGGEDKVSLSEDAIDLSSESTTTAYDKGLTTITASNVTTSTTVKAGVGGDFINGAYALETGEEKNGTTLVDNATVLDADGNTRLARPFVIAAEVNENNTSDRNSTGAHTNPLLTESSTIFYHDKEASITGGTIKAALSHDAIQFTADATGDLKPKLVTASKTARTLSVDGTDTIFNTLATRSNVTSYSSSDASIGGDFINNGEITVSLSNRAINGESIAKGTLGDVATTEIKGSDVNQTTISKAGVVGDFKNVAVSQEVGAATLYTENSGSSDNSTEVARAVYARTTNVNAPKISSSLADDAINFNSTANNEVSVKSTSAAEAVVHRYGSGTDTGTTNKYSESIVTADAGSAVSNVSSTTKSVAGIGGNFINDGKISVSLAKDAVNAESTGNTNVIDSTSASIIEGTNLTANMESIAGVRGDFTNNVTALDTGSATALYHDVYNIATNTEGTAYEYSPKYYENNDSKEGERVKSNVLDRGALVYDRTEVDGSKSKDVLIATDGIVYDKELAKGEIGGSLANASIQLNAETTTTIKPATIGTSDVDVVTLHTGYVDATGVATSENNASRVDSNRTVKVVSNITERSTVVAGVGGKFTNKNKISSSLAKELISATGEATSTFGDEATTAVTGGVHSSITNVISGIGRGTSSSNKGFLNAADTYDSGAVKTDTTDIRVAANSVNDNPYQLIASTANDYLDDNATTPLKLQDSKTVAFWDKELVVAQMTSALAADNIKVDAVATGKLTPNSVTAATGVVDKNISGTIESFDVVGNYVYGEAKTKISQETTTKAGIDGDFINQGKIENSLSGQLVNAESTATGSVGDIGNTVVSGSILEGKTSAYAGVTGDFRNEVVSLDLNNGEAIVTSNAYDANPVVVYDKTTTVGKVKLATNLSKENLNFRSNATSNIDIKSSSASDAIKDSRSHVDVPEGGVYDATLSTFKADAITAKASISSTVKSYAGIGGDFYNTGDITSALSKDLMDGTAKGTNNIDPTGVSIINGTDITSEVLSYAGVQGSFTNDVVSLDTGAKTLLYKDVYTLDSDNNRVSPDYYVYHGDNHDNNITGGFTDAPIATDGTRVKSNVVDRVLYDKEVVEAQNSSSLSKVSAKFDAEAVVSIKPDTLGVSDVNVITINDSDHTKFDANRTIKVVSNLTSKTNVYAGIGERFTNASKLSASLSKDVISAYGKATTDFGDSTKTKVVGGHISDKTVVRAGIGNDENSTNKSGFINLANTYDDGAVQIGHSKIISGANNGSHALIASNNEHDANVDENTTTLNLIDSADVAYWNKKLVVGEITASLSSQLLNLEGTATSTLNPLKISSASSDVNLTAKDTLVAVDGYLVAGDARANVEKSTIVYSGVDGGFVNQGKIASSLAKEVLNVQAIASGTLGDIGNTEIVGADVTSYTAVLSGIRNGGFRNEVLSLDLNNGAVYTQLEANGVESAKVVYDKTTTVGKVEMSTATSGADVLLLDSEATNTLDAKSISAADAVLGNAGLDSALAARSNVKNETAAIGGIDGDFYNSGKLSAATAQNVIASSATSSNVLGSAIGTVNGSIVTALSSADSTINGDFVNDTVLLDDGAATIKYKKTADGNDSNVVDTITYEQKIAKGEILSNTSKDVLRMVATGTNNISLSEVGNSEVTVASVDTNGYVTGASSDHNVSSSITATNVAKSGIMGKFVNAGDMIASTATDALNFQAVGGASNLLIATMGGGDVNASNTVVSGINLGGGTGPAFLNDKRDFNTVLATDATYDATKVVTGTIKADTAKDAIKLVATGGAISRVYPDTEIITHGQNGAYDIAMVTNTNNNLAIINGDFVNRGDIIASTANFALNMTATNEAKNDVGAGVVSQSGMLSSTVDTKSVSTINGNLINSGLIKAATATAAINLVADAQKSEAVGAMADVNATEYAGQHNIKISSTNSLTESSMLALSNTGVIQGADGAKAIVLDAKGAVDSSTFDLGSVTNSASSAVLVNNLTSKASIASIYNSGEIKTADATVIDVKATGSAKTAADGDEIKSSYENTTAVVTASIGNIINDAFTTHNAKKDVDKAFNGGVQLLPTEEVVAANGGEYDFTSFNEVSDTNALSEDTDYSLSTGTLVARTLEFNTTEELNALAYNDNNTSDNPALSQTIGKITTGTGTAAISLVANATESEFATVTAKAGNVLNKGVIDGGTGKGIYLSATGDSVNGDASAEGAKAYATIGQIYNASTHQTFESAKEGTLHAIINGEIKGEAGAIVLSAVGEADQNVSIATADQIVNARTVLNAGDKVISSLAGDADGLVIANATDTDAVTNTDANYAVDTLDKDTAFLATIGSGADKVAIDIGENAHVTNGIHNYGQILGQVKLGDADLYLYGLVETNTSKLSNNLFMSQAELASAGDFEQAAGLVTSTAGITNSYAGSSVVFEGAHLFNDTASGHQIPAIEADEIKIAKGAIVNIADDQAFDLTKATDIYNRGLKQTFVNEGILNVAAGKKVTITGNYQGVNSGLDTCFITDGSATSFAGHFVTNVIAGNINVDDNNTFDQAGGTYGQLAVTGNADLAGGIGVRVDDPTVNLYALTTTETRLKDVVTAGTLSIGDANITHEGGNTQTALGVKVTDNVSAYDFRAVEGTTSGDVDLVVVARAVESVEEGGLVIDTPRVAIESTRNFSSVIDTRIDMSSGYIGKLEGNSGVPVVHINTSGEESKGVSGRATVGSEGNDRDGENAGTNRNTQPSLFAKTNYWIKPFAGRSEQDSVGDIAGYDTSTYGLAFGADKEYGDWFVGLAGALAKSNASSTSGPSSSTETTMFQGSMYGSKRVGDGMLNLQAGAGFLTNERTRLAEAEGTNVEADYDGYVVQAKATYEQAAKLNSDTLLIPYVSGELAHVENDGYTETGAKNAIQSVGSTSADAAILSVGTKAKYKLTDDSAVVGTVGVGYDFLAKEQEYSTTYVDAKQSATLYGAKPEKLEYNLGLAYQVETGGGTQVKVGVDYTGRNGYDSAIGSARFYFPF